MIFNPSSLRGRGQVEGAPISDRHLTAVSIEEVDLFQRTRLQSNHATHLAHFVYMSSLRMMTLLGAQGSHYASPCDQF
jgi:hypothetical protein